MPVQHINEAPVQHVNEMSTQLVNETPIIETPIPSGTENKPAPEYDPPRQREEKSGRRILTAQIDGVNYTAEMCRCLCVLTGRKKKDKKNPQRWTPEEDELLRKAVEEMGERRWREIADRVPHRTHVQCLQRWKKKLKPGLKTGHWSEEEDRLLLLYKDKFSNWAEVAKHIEGRTPKQCRERWCNHVDPRIRKG